ncbi:MAG: polyphenol oxidase family protein [Spirochaetia bacterium]|nr:polyphenol oxidase family protein [Spirochaetia bacterium]
MIYNTLQINLEFPVELGTYYIHIWGKPDISSGKNDEPIDLVEQQFNELRNHYLKVFNLKLSILKQVHGNCTVNACTNDNELAEADSFFTTDDNNALAIKTADCIPILFFNSRDMFLGAIHSGWRGLELEILKSALNKALLTKKNKINDLIFIIGPHIYKENYETDSEVYNKFPQVYSDQIASSTKRNLNLKKILENQFINCGIQKSQTIWLNHNTFGSHQFFSHRSKDKGRNFNIIFFKKALNP